MPRDTPEGRVKAAVKKVLDRHGEQVYAHWAVPAGYGRQTLDCYGSINGVAFAVETKAPGKKPTPIQQVIIAEMEKAGMRVFVIDGADSLAMAEFATFLKIRSVSL